MKTKDLILYTSIGLLMILLIFQGTAVNNSRQDHIQQINDLNSAHESEISDLNTTHAQEIENKFASSAIQIDEANATITEQSETISSLKNELVSAQSEFESCQNELGDAYAELEAASESRDDLSTQFTDQSLECELYKEFALCSERQPEIIYDSNLYVSESLAKWIRENLGPIIDTNWDTIWNDDNTAIHYFQYRVQNNYQKAAFIAYYNEPNIDYHNAIFFIDRGCWLDLSPGN